MTQKTFTMRRHLLWGESDPAAIVYTPRYFHLAVEAVETFFREALELRFVDIGRIHGGDWPWVHASGEFVANLPAGDPFDMHVSIERLGNSSVSYAVSGRALDGSDLFRMRLVGVMVDGEARRPRPIPDAIRAKLAPYAPDA